MDSIRNHNYEEQNEQPGSGLLRFRSAPSSFMVNFADNVANNESGSDFHQEFEGKSSAVRVREGAVGYTNSPQGYSGLPPHYPRQTSAASTSAMDGSYGLIGSLGMAHHGQLKSVDSGLARQSSSPPGLFALHQHGYGGMRIVGTYAGMDGTNIEVSPRLKTQFSLSPRVPSSLGMLSQISEIDSESIGASSPDNGKPGNGAGDGRFYSSSGFPYSSWSESHFPANFNGTKRDQENSEKLFSSTQQGELGSRVNVLSHHLSLPKSSAEMAAVEKMLHFQDSVPCKIRAKRGCATHPRSIAERLRRTRISERMRKLQELVPNMDKQTNTADMLDLAVDYIKELQKQYKTLCDNRANCKCISKQKPVQNQIV